MVIISLFQKYMVKGLVAGAVKDKCMPGGVSGVHIIKRRSKSMLTTSKEMLLEASKNGYAVPGNQHQGGNYDII